MSYKNVEAHALGHLRAANSSNNSYLELSCGHITLGQLLCDMSCIVNDNHSKQKSLAPHGYLKSRQVT